VIEVLSVNGSTVGGRRRRQRMDLGQGLGHLSCSTLVHQGDRRDSRDSVATHGPRRKAPRLADPARGPLAASLQRLGARARWRPSRSGWPSGVPTVAGPVCVHGRFCPYGPFKERELMEQVYGRPIGRPRNAPGTSPGRRRAGRHHGRAGRAAHPVRCAGAPLEADRQRLDPEVLANSSACTPRPLLRSAGEPALHGGPATGGAENRGYGRVRERGPRGGTS
jgi:hypothetical protein